MERIDELGRRKFPRLFEPLKIGSVTVPNRIMFPPFGINWANADGTLGDKLRDLYLRVAEGGSGTVYTGAAGVNLDNVLYEHGMKLFTREHAESNRALCRELERRGAVPGIQLMNYGRQARTDFTGKPPYAPSAVPCEAMRALDPDYEVREMREEDIDRVKNEYVNAAVLAAEVGYKIVQLHGAHGFLLAQFLSPHTNHRRDAYGGSPENRARIVVETIRAIRKALGTQVAIDLRVSGDEVLGEGGLQPKDFEKIVPLFEEAGLDLLNVSMCAGFDTPDVLIAGLEPQARWSYASRQLRQYASVPVGHAGFIGSLDLGERLLERGHMDLVGYGRTQFADNDFIRKCVEGREKDIVKCIWCGECYQYLLSVGHSPSCCMVNGRYKCKKKTMTNQPHA